MMLLLSISRFFQGKKALLILSMYPIGNGRLSCTAIFNPTEEHTSTMHKSFTPSSGFTTVEYTSKETFI